MVSTHAMVTTNPMKLTNPMDSTKSMVTTNSILQLSQLFQLIQCLVWFAFLVHRTICNVPIDVCTLQNPVMLRVEGAVSLKACKMCLCPPPAQACS